MPLDDRKKYLLNGDPVSAKELIEQAMAMDKAYANDWLHLTSTAANVMRVNGYTVAHNPAYPEEAA